MKAGISAAAIHGNKSQTARQQALSDFKAGRIQVLVATDIAARGIDIEELSHVFNYNLSEVPETYVHRIGRTGRAGHGGCAVSFCDFAEKEYLRGIEKLIGRNIPVVEEHPWPMEVFEAPRDAKGRAVNADDAEDVYKRQAIFCCRMTDTAAALSSIRQVKDTLYPFAIFHKTEIVGLTSPFSICANILLDTPVAAAAASRVSFLCSRMLFTFRATTFVTSIHHLSR